MIETARRRAHQRTARVGELARSANSFGLFRTGDELERIHRQLAHFPTLREELKPKRAQSIVLMAERTEPVLEDEHSDVELSTNLKGKVRVALVASCGLFALQIANLAAAITKPFFTPDFIEQQHPNSIAAAAIVLLAAFPARQFYLGFRFSRVKDEIADCLQDVRDRMREERDHAARKARGKD